MSLGCQGCWGIDDRCGGAPAEGGTGTTGRRPAGTGNPIMHNTNVWNGAQCWHVYGRPKLCTGVESLFIIVARWQSPLSLSRAVMLDLVEATCTGWGGRQWRREGEYSTHEQPARMSFCAVGRSPHPE